MSATIIKLPYGTTRRAFARRPRCSDNGTPEERATRQRSGANMRTAAFRSTAAILAASTADLTRDVGLDLHKAGVKLRKIREQMRRDRARDTMMSLAEAKLAGALEDVSAPG